MKLSKELILASGSPRRSELLTEMGCSFIVRPLDIDESFSDDMPVDQVAEFLARKKALAYPSINDNQLILAADSIVVCRDKIYGKPHDFEGAQAMLRELSGQLHYVYTGVCFRSATSIHSFTERADVQFAELTEDEINYYITQYKPYDKAGSYGIQDWLGTCKVSSLKGTFSNVKGLPTAQVYEYLKQFQIQ